MSTPGQFDRKLLAVALARVAIDAGERHSLDDVVAELGIDEDAHRVRCAD